MKNSLQAFEDFIAKKIFGITKAEALERLICIHCKKDITPENVYSEAGIREYNVSGLCEPCFDELTSPPTEQ